MTFKINIKLILLFTIITICFSCTEKKKALKKKEETKVGSVYTMQPYLGNLPDLKPSEKEKLQQTIESFYNEKYIPNDFSGSILVAKNGHVVYENYRGMSNFEEKKAINIPIRTDGNKTDNWILVTLPKLPIVQTTNDFKVDSLLKY